MVDPSESTLMVREVEILTAWASVEDDNDPAVVKIPILRRIRAL